MQVPERRGGYTLVEFLVVLGIVAILAAILFPVTFRTSCGYSPRFACQSNLRQVGLAFLQYTQDYDERMVPIFGSRASGDPYGWADALLPYHKSTQLLQCPAEATFEVGEDAAKSGYTDYWMNERLNRAALKRFTSPAQTILCGDGNDGTEKTDARYSIKRLRRSWLRKEDSPAYRHIGTMNILFADGHVKALKAERIVLGAPRQEDATFAPSWLP